MLSKIFSAGVAGVDAYRVEVEVDVARALPTFSIVGLPDGAVKESRDRVRAAMKNSGFAFPQTRVTVNLAPADIKKEGAGFDLPIALAVLVADGGLKNIDLTETCFIGELALDGAVRPVKGVLAMAARAAQMGIRRLVVPRVNAMEAAVVEGLDVSVADSLGQLVELLETDGLTNVEADAEGMLALARDNPEVDFSEVRGQAHAKRALEIAAAGGHNILMVGPPGTGKTMLARRLPTILPSLTQDEAVQTSRIYSVAGLLDADRPLVVERPFRSPHHTVSDAGLVGGGVVPRPGEVTLSHNGVLFLDELPEFKRNVLDLLRQPLEDAEVTIVRAAGAMRFPARFMLLGAMNPCPCGYRGDPKRECICAGSAIERYVGRISGPLIDRFDIRVEVPAVRYDEMAGSGSEEASAVIRERVRAARQLQSERLSGLDCHSNAQLGAKATRELCVVDDDAAAVLKRAMEQMGLSARGFTRTLKVARTIADLDSAKVINRAHALEALGLRLSDPANAT